MVDLSLSFLILKEEEAAFRALVKHKKAALRFLFTRYILTPTAEFSALG